MPQTKHTPELAKRNPTKMSRHRDTDDRPRIQADGLDLWARVLEAHDPDGSAAGIVMLHEAAKTLRELAAAPKLLGALQDIVNWDRKTSTDPRREVRLWSELISAAQAAIAKAEVTS